MRCLVLRPEIALILVVSGTVGYGHSARVDAPPPPPWTDDLQAAADANNKWVEDKTRVRVRELLKPGSITPQTVMVLANAIHFKGTWKTKFDPTRTRDATFHLADDTTATVPLMYVNAKARHGMLSDPVNRKLTTQVLELPYTGGELSLVVILPALPDGLPAVERQLTAETLKTWIAGLRETQLGVSLPRFKQEQAFSLPEQLKALGMVRAFGAGADFTGMLDSGGISISAVQHKAFVEVNEEGTEAAAATAVTGEKSPDPIPFVADHPFLFLIRDARHGTILFLGRVERP